MSAPSVAPHVALTETDVESIVLGSMIRSPEVMQAIAEDLNPDWFADPGVRLFLDAALALHSQGHTVTPAVLGAKISPAVEFEGTTRNQFIARMVADAMPLAYLGGFMVTLRDRWARRLLNTEGARLQADATAIECDPFEAVGDAITALDAVNMARGERLAGSLAASTDALFESFAATKPKPATTGLRVVDDKLGGYAPGKLIILGARPGMGKSAFACSSLRRTAAAGDGVALFSLEMGKDEVAARCMADAMDNVRAPFFGSILKGQFTPDEGDAMMEARQTFDALPMEIDASASLTFSAIAARARKYKAAFEAKGKRLAVVCIDHMGLVTPSDRYKGNKVAETGEVSRAGKILAKELGCCVVLLCQLSREVEKRDDQRPTLADLRWSGDIEQDADVVAFLYREYYYLSQKPDSDPEALSRTKHRLDFLIRKNRNGDVGDVPLWCSIAHSAIRDFRP